MTDILKQLSEPFPPALISWRVGSTTKDKSKGMALAYIDARDVQDRLDKVCGANWQCRFPHAGQKTVCEIGVKIGDEWLWRADGAGDTDVEQEKGALSDAFKRAAVKWGIGRYLYDMDSPWLELEQKGNSYAFTAGSLAKLRGQKPPAPAASSTPPAVAASAIKAATPQEWLDLFTKGVENCHSIGVLNNFMDFNRGWLNKLPQDLKDKGTHALEKRMSFLGQAPISQAAE